jgi:hypothetical protein
MSFAIRAVPGARRPREARCAGRFSWRHEATRYIREGKRHLSRQERLLPSLKATVVDNHALAALFLHAVINVSASYGANYPASGYSAPMRS